MCPHPRTILVALIPAAVWLGGGFASAAEPAISPEAIEFFEKRVRPILAAHCYECHSASAKELKGGLRLDDREGVLAGGDNGPAIVAGQPDSSRLVTAIRYHDADLQMPPGGKLADAQIADLVAWIKMGAPDPRKRTAGAPPPTAAIDFDKARKFWSFQPVADPPPPKVNNESWVRTEIDRFILAKLESRGIQPLRDADKRTLIRRVTFTLTGLPPTPDEVEAFVADDSAKALESVVDRLLASRHYGEHWGRHWLDLVRYADTSGCNSDYPIPSAYKYRNWVIESINRDLPYDEFLRQQIAGDLLPAENDQDRYDQIIATGYLATARRFGSRAAEFHLTLEDTIDNLGKTVLGLSLACARCHDHKYDPVPTADYYALYGIFNSTRFAFPGTEIFRHPKDFVPLASGDKYEEVRKYQTEHAALDEEIENLLEEKRAFERRQAAVATQAVSKSGRSLVEVKAALEDARDRQRKLENNPPKVELAYAVSEGKPANARIQKKGDPKQPGDEVPRGYLQILGGQRVDTGSAVSGRKELAFWLTDPANPLVSRVIVNRVWQYHFGRGIVPTPSDFGLRGQPPTHPELLDWLATRFVRGGWSFKSLHKLLLLSHVYHTAARDESAESRQAAAADPNNELCWSAHRRRLSAEEIRDAMLAVSGGLDRTPGGPHPFPPEEDWRYTQHKPFVADYQTSRRSVYLMQQRIRRQPFLEVFDGADTNATTPIRPASTTAIQALYLMNSPLVHDEADRFAVRVGLAHRLDRERIDYAYRLALARPATEEEVASGERYLREAAAALGDSKLPRDQHPRAALASYLRVLLASNEFLHIE
jgi:hypothetical protein